MKLIKSYAIKKALLQFLLIGFCFIASIFLVSLVLQQLLLKTAMQQEVDTFIEHYQQNPAYPLPRTRNLRGYLVADPNDPALPEMLRGKDAGFYKNAEQDKPFQVARVNDRYLYLVFEGGNVDRLVGIYGILPLSLVLLFVYLVGWLGYFFGSKAISPVLAMASKLRQSQPDQQIDLESIPVSGETRELADAICEYQKRIEQFVERERQFTADISHELRTPVTIIDGAAQFLAIDRRLSDKSRQRVSMIRRAAHDINELIEAFFVMGRECKPEQMIQVDPQQVAKDMLQQLQALAFEKQIQFAIDASWSGRLQLPGGVLEIVLGNLLRNAIFYAPGSLVTVSLQPQNSGLYLAVTDQGPGIEDALIKDIYQRHVRGRGIDQAGEGIGLSIVKRLCDQFAIELSLTNRTQGGLEAGLYFSGSFISREVA